MISQRKKLELLNKLIVLKSTVKGKKDLAQLNKQIDSIGNNFMSMAALTNNLNDSPLGVAEAIGHANYLKKLNDYKQRLGTMTPDMFTDKKYKQNFFLKHKCDLNMAELRKLDDALDRGILEKMLESDCYRDSACMYIDFFTKVDPTQCHWRNHW